MNAFVDKLVAADAIRIDAPAWGALVDGLLVDVAMAASDEPLFDSDHEDAYTCGVEPSSEPCTDAIPYADLVFWLGSAATGRVDCACAACSPPPVQLDQAYAPTVHGHYVFIPPSRSRGLSSKIPVIALPRIEGVN